MNKYISAVLATLGLSTVIATASPVNIGFETGDFTGWTTNGGPASVVSSYVSQNSTVFTAPEGTYFALLTGGLGVNVATTVTQSFTLNAGDVISGNAGFFADDYSPFNDYGAASMSIGSGSTNLFFANISSVGGQNGTTGWTPWSYTAATSGTYTLTYSAANTGDNSYNSHAFFDTSVSSSVPDVASTLALLTLGLVGMVSFRRRMIKA